MANRDNHYEAAFEEYLRARRIPYVAVDEARRSVMADGQSIDPVVKLLVDRGLSLRHLVERKETLEDVFMKTVEGAEPGVDRKSRRGARPVGGGE